MKKQTFPKGHKKLFISFLVFVMFLLVISFVFAVVSTEPTDYSWWENGSVNHTGGDIVVDVDKQTEHGWDFDGLGSGSDTTSLYETFDGNPSMMFACQAGNNCVYNTDSFDVDDIFTVEILFHVTAGNVNSFTRMGMSNDVTTPLNGWAGIKFVGTASNIKWDGQGFGSGCPGDVGSGGVFAREFNRWYEIKLSYTPTGITCIIDGTPCTNSCSYASTTDFNNYMSFTQDNHHFNIRNFTIYNGTVKPQAPLPDTTPPVITDAGCKSCTPYQEFLSTPWISDDTTTTYNLTTDEASTCAVMTNETGTNEYSYTDMISNGGVDCTTTGDIQHICTVQESNAFTLGSNKNVSFACKDSLDNEGTGSLFSKLMGIYTFGLQCISNCIKAVSGCGLYLESGCTIIR